MTPRQEVAALAYTKYRKGESLTNGEVSAGMHEFGKASDFLRALGPAFHFPMVELLLVGQTFKQFARARGMRVYE